MKHNSFLVVIFFPGLFHRSILIAGSSNAPWALISDPFVVGQSVAAALNCSTGGGGHNNGSSSLGGGNSGDSATTTSSPHHSSDPVLECLKTKHFSEFTKFSLPKFSVDFGPSIDGVVIKPNFRVSVRLRKYDVENCYFICLLIKPTYLLMLH